MRASSSRTRCRAPVIFVIIRFVSQDRSPDPSPWRLAAAKSLNRTGRETRLTKTSPPPREEEVTERPRQGIGNVRRFGNFGEPQFLLDRALNLLLRRSTVTGDRLLDARRGVRHDL